MSTKEKLINAIEHNNIESLYKIINTVSLLDFPYLNDALFYGHWEIAKILLQHGAKVTDGENYESDFGEALTWEIPDYNIVLALLKIGSNPNVYFDTASKETHLKNRLSEINIRDKINYKLSKIFLEYGSVSFLNQKNGMCNCSALEATISSGKHYKHISLLLDYGADPAIPDEYGDSMLNALLTNKEKYTSEDYAKVEKLLNPNNPPYLKLGDSKDDKYIIYENRQFEALSRGIVPYTDVTPYVFSDKKKHKNKKYLYADNKIDTFIYWCYTNNLLAESVIPRVKLYEEKLGQINYKNINSFITNIIGDKVTTEYFNEEGKAFATSYLTVTHWWYNLHTDFNRLYQDENIKLPRAIKSQEEFDTLMKLLDIRHEQFKSKKDFNSNQNKEELEALIEGKAPPKRVVDLSWLEEETNDIEADNNIIPDDFFKDDVE